MIVNSVRVAIDSAVEGAEKVRSGALEVVLSDHEHDPIPAQLVMPYGRLNVPKVRAFADLAVPKLRAHFTRIREDCGAIPA